MPRVISLEVEMPDDADPAVWEKFVSWWNEQGCERGFIFVMNLWDARTDAAAEHGR
jgi:hypothetical protein